AGGRVCTPAPDRLLHAATHGAVGVRASDQHEVRIEPIPRIDRGAILPDRLLTSDDRLAGDVTAALREDLIFDMDAGNTRLGVFLYRALRGQCVAVPVV